MAIDGVGYKNFSRIPFKGEEQQERSSGMGMGVPIVTTLGGGAVGYFLVPGKMDEDTFQKKAVADEKIEYTKDLDDAEKALEKDAIAEAKAKAAESKDAPKTDPAKAEPAKTAPVAAEAPAAAKTPAQAELEAKVKHFYPGDIKEIHPETLIEGYKVEKYTTILEKQEADITTAKKGLATLKEAAQIQETVRDGSRTALAEELNIAQMNLSPADAAALKERNKRLSEAKVDLRLTQEQFDRDIKDFFPEGHSQRVATEGKIKKLQEEIGALQEQVSSPHEKLLTKAEKVSQEAQDVADKAKKALQEAQEAAVKSGTSEAVKESLAKLETEALIKQGLADEAKALLDIQKLSDSGLRIKSLQGRVKINEKEVKDAKELIGTSEAEIKKLVEELETKRTYLNMAKEAGTGTVSKETFTERFRKGLSDVKQKIADAVGAKPTEGAAKEGESAVKTFLTKVAEKLPKSKTITRGLVGAGVGLVAGLAIKWIFGGKSEA